MIFFQKRLLWTVIRDWTFRIRRRNLLHHGCDSVFIMIPPLPSAFVLVLVDLRSKMRTDGGGEGRGVGALDEYTEGVSAPPFVDLGSRPRSNQLVPPRRPRPRSRAAFRPKSISRPCTSSSESGWCGMAGTADGTAGEGTAVETSSVRSEEGASVDDDANTVFIIESHSSDLSAPKPSMRIGASSGGCSWAEPSPRDVLSELAVREWEDEMADIWLHCEGRIAESRDVERAVEKSIPSSATSSPEKPPHSSLRLRSMGVPRPAYLINGHEPRAVVVDPVVAPRCGDDSFFLDFFWGKGDTRDMNDVDRESIGDDGGDGVSGGRMDVDGVGDEGAERQERSRLKSPNPSKIVPRIAGSAAKRIVLSSLSSTSTCTATTASFTVSRPKDSGLRSQ